MITIPIVAADGAKSTVTLSNPVINASSRGVSFPFTFPVTL